MGQRLAQFAQLRRLAQDSIHVSWNVPVGNEALTPSGQHQENRRRRSRLDGTRNLAPIHVGHTEIRHYDREPIALSLRRQEGIDAGLASIRRRHAVTVQSNASRNDFSTIGSSSTTRIRSGGKHLQRCFSVRQCESSIAILNVLHP